ncbi:MAG: CBS domain-containing protein [Pseudomonadales bacterium]|nr:CBS domain-containing protein [Pseudomonadales bacterium]
MNEERHKSGSPNKSLFDKLSTLLSGEPKNRDELLDVLKSAQERELIDNEALGTIQGAIVIAEMQAREIMIPRTQMVVVNITDTAKEFLPAIIKSQHSRFPVVGDKPDEILGILLAKDLLPLAAENKLDKADLKNIIRPATFVPESKRLNVLLNDFRANRNHMALVINEYGGVAGLVTIEDVLEQIVGEIEDEHDSEDDYLIKRSATNQFIVKALTPIDDFNTHFKTDFSEDEFDTIGGIVMNHFGHLPERDESVRIGSYLFKVLNADNRTIRLLEVSPQKHAQLEL